MVINTEKAPAAIGPYSQTIQVGKVLYTSGQLGMDPATGILQEGVEKQAEQSLMNIAEILSEAGYGKADVVKTTVFIKDMNDFAKANQIYVDFFGDHKPARSCVEVARLNGNESQCSFCGKWSNDVDCMIAGPHGLYICSECVSLCVQILEDVEKEDE